MPLPILEVLQVDDDVFVPVRARVLMPEAQQVQQLVQDSVNGCNLAQDQTIFIIEKKEDVENKFGNFCSFG